MPYMRTNNKECSGGMDLQGLVGLRMWEISLTVLGDGGIQHH